MENDRSRPGIHEILQDIGRRDRPATMRIASTTRIGPRVSIMSEIGEPKQRARRYYVSY